MDFIIFTAIVSAISAINWGLTEFYDLDLVRYFSPNPDFEYIVKITIGLCGLYFLLFVMTKLSKIKI